MPPSSGQKSGEENVQKCKSNSETAEGESSEKDECVVDEEENSLMEEEELVGGGPWEDAEGGGEGLSGGGVGGGMAVGEEEAVLLPQLQQQQQPLPEELHHLLDEEPHGREEKFESLPNVYFQDDKDDIDHLDPSHLSPTWRTEEEEEVELRQREEETIANCNAAAGKQEVSSRNDLFRPWSDDDGVEEKEELDGDSDDQARAYSPDVGENVFVFCGGGDEEHKPGATSSSHESLKDSSSSSSSDGVGDDSDDGNGEAHREKNVGVATARAGTTAMATGSGNIVGDGGGGAPEPPPTPSPFPPATAAEASLDGESLPPLSSPPPNASSTSSGAKDDEILKATLRRVCQRYLHEHHESRSKFPPILPSGLGFESVVRQHAATETTTAPRSRPLEAGCGFAVPSHGVTTLAQAQAEEEEAAPKTKSTGEEEDTGGSSPGRITTRGPYKCKNCGKLLAGHVCEAVILHYHKGTQTVKGGKDIWTEKCRTIVVRELSGGPSDNTAQAEPIAATTTCGGDAVDDSISLHPVGASFSERALADAAAGSPPVKGGSGSEEGAKDSSTEKEKPIEHEKKAGKK